jgi:hypothetical protein
VSRRPVTKSPIITLQPRDGSRRLVYPMPPGVDRIYISSEGTTADINRVRVSVDDGDYITLSEFVPVGEYRPPPRQIILEWDPTEDNKTIQFIFGRDYYKRDITYVEVIKSWDIAPKLDDIISQIDTLISTLPLTASDYDIISLDLSVSRTDVLIAQNVIFLKVLESTTPNASYTIKLFDPSKPPITQSMLPPGGVIERLRRARVYISNTAQSVGVKLDLFVFMG